MTKNELYKATDPIVVDPVRLRALHQTMQRTDTAAFRDAQNILFLLIEQAEPLPMEVPRDQGRDVSGQSAHSTDNPSRP